MFMFLRANVAKGHEKQFCPLIYVHLLRLMVLMYFFALELCIMFCTSKRKCSPSGVSIDHVRDEEIAHNTLQSEVNLLRFPEPAIG